MERRDGIIYVIGWNPPTRSLTDIPHKLMTVCRVIQLVCQQFSVSGWILSWRQFLAWGFFVGRRILGSMSFLFQSFMDAPTSLETELATHENFAENFHFRRTCSYTTAPEAVGTCLQTRDIFNCPQLTSKFVRGLETLLRESHIIPNQNR